MSPERSGAVARGAGAARCAVYYMPGDDEPLARFGARVLGRWPDGRDAAAVGSPKPAPDCCAGRVARPRRYGFHATLKAPFRLEADATLDALVRAAGECAARAAPVPAGALRLRHEGRSTFLETAEPVPALDALAADVVTSLDHLRAPVTDADRDRRGVGRLDAAARARFERWGYPWVLDGFRFHLTLGAGGPPTTPAEDARWLGWLRGWLQECAVGPLVLDRLVVCRQDAEGGEFVRLAEIPLRGPPGDGAADRRPPGTSVPESPRS